MDCTKYHKDISALVDGELAPNASADLRMHLSACPDCRATLEAMTELNNQLKAVSPLADSAMTSRIKDRIRSQNTEDTRRTALPLWGQAPLLALIVLLAIGLGNLAGKSISEIFLAETSDTITELMLPESTRSLADVMMDLSPEEPIR